MCSRLYFKKCLRSVAFFMVAAILIVPKTGVGGEAENAVIFRFRPNTERINGWFSTLEVEEVVVDWGGGTRETFSGERQRYNKQYEEDGEWIVTVRLGIRAF